MTREDTHIGSSTEYASTAPDITSLVVELYQINKLGSRTTVHQIKNKDNGLITFHSGRVDVIDCLSLET